MLTNLDTVNAQDTTSAEEAVGRLRNPRRGKPEPTPTPPLAPTILQRCYAPVRRALDFSAALTLFVVSCPVLLLAALAVRLSSRGPAFYTQVRTGRGGRPFTIYKIRTMVDNCESLTGARWSTPGDPRVTRPAHLQRLRVRPPGGGPGDPPVPQFSPLRGWPGGHRPGCPRRHMRGRPGTGGR